MAKVVDLRKKWTLGKRIGEESGFGKVFEATCEDGTVGVVKVIPKVPGSDRELLFENLAGVPNIVPILDIGETKDSWLIAMPRAERSLRAEIKAAGGQLGTEHAVPILIDVARALAGIDGRVVHRDLKPENVLLLDGSWSLADFGVAKYAEASTSTETWKGTFSRAYAAPERWQFDHATGATDIYSLGVMAYELVVGVLPFNGPAIDDFRNQHVNEPVARALAGQGLDGVARGPCARVSQVEDDHEVVDLRCRLRRGTRRGGRSRAGRRLRRAAWRHRRWRTGR